MCVVRECIDFMYRSSLYSSWTILLFIHASVLYSLHASVSQGRICSDDFACCHTEIEVAGQIFHLTQSQYTDTGPTSPSTYLITPGRVAIGVPILKSLV